MELVGTQELFVQYMFVQSMYNCLLRQFLYPAEQARLAAAGAAWVAAGGELQQLPADRVKLFMDKSNIMQTGS